MKLVLLVRSDLGMSVGKVSAQVAHAAVLAALGAPDSAKLRRWLEEGQPKIVLSVRDGEQLRRLVQAAEQAGLPVHVVHDAGRTQVPPETPTSCAVGPAENVEIDRVTGSLPLL